MLANLCVIRLDIFLESRAAEAGLPYTRYADGLFFSTHEKNLN